MALSMIERAWLVYARSVVQNEEHRLACEAAGGSPPNHPGVDASDVRWPGYLGRNYAPGGVLCVATVHRDFASAGVGVAIRDRLVSGTRQWKAGGIDDEAYLAAVRDGYEAGLRQWTVGNNIGAALQCIGTDIQSICYVNAARCQYPEIEPKAPAAEAKRTKAALVHFCLSTFPIEDLVGLLQAAVVLFTNVAAYDRTKPRLPKDVVAVAIHQQLTRRYAPLARPLVISGESFPEKTRVGVWSPSVRAYLHDRTVSSHAESGGSVTLPPVSPPTHPADPFEGLPLVPPIPDRTVSRHAESGGSNALPPVSPPHQTDPFKGLLLFPSIRKGHDGKVVGWCKCCDRADAAIYDQKAGVHNAECQECFAIYAAIKGYPGRTGGNCRHAQRRAIEEIKRTSSPVERSPVNDLPPEIRSAAMRIQQKLESHPSRRAESVNRALRLILQSI